jgi:hypothetical protein
MTNFQGAGTGIAGTTVSRTVDGGRHWSEVLDANHQAANDRPFLLDAGRHDLLLTYATQAGDIEAVRSTDDGASFGLPIPVTPVPPQLAELDLNGGPVYDRARHQLVVPYGFAPPPGCGGLGCWNLVGLARSSDDGRSWSQERVAIFPDNAWINSAFDVAADAEGREYAAFAVTRGDTTEIWFTRSIGPGRPWSQPVRLDRPGAGGMLP